MLRSKLAWLTSLLALTVSGALAAPLPAFGKAPQVFQFVVPLESITDGADPIPQVALEAWVSGGSGGGIEMEVLTITDGVDPIPTKVLASVPSPGKSAGLLTVVDEPDPFGKSLQVSVIVDDPDPLGVTLLAYMTDGADPIP